MALHRPDYTMENARKVVENLGDSEEHEAIKYYIKKTKEWTDKQEVKLKEYESFFNLMKKLLPRSFSTNRPLI